MASSSTGYRGRFGDTTTTKVFVGGLAWETPTEELRRHFEQFGDILEAVIITDKNTGRSKGYGFVTFRDAESARRSVAEPNPVIDGRRANCNIAALGRPRGSPPRGRNPSGGIYQAPLQATSHPYSRVPAQMPPPPPSVLYPTPYGYMTYPADYRYQQEMYNAQMSQMTPQYYPDMYGPSSPANATATPYYPQMGYTMHTPRASYPSNAQAYHPYMQYPRVHIEGPFTPSLPQSFQLQAPPHARQSHTIADSQNPQQPSTTLGSNDSSNA